MSDSLKQNGLDFNGEVEEVKEQEETKEISVSTNSAPVVAGETGGTQTDVLLRMAVEKDLDIDKLEKLIELKNKEEDRISKKEFWVHFSDMQREIPTAKRTKDAGNWKYAPLESVLTKEVRDIIAKHGFALTWTEDTSVKDVFTAICIVSGYGYQERFPSSVPYSTDTRGGKNSLQQRGETKLYAKRYAVMDALGIVVENEDTDGVFNLEELYKIELDNIKTADSLEMLDEMYKALKERVSDAGHMAYLEEAIRNRRLEVRNRIQNGTA